jgi:Mn2+/Fe2+ NRAMP family transporter
VASLAIACFGATLEIALSLAYLVAQGFGWQWGEDLPPRADARFALMYTLLIAAAALFVLFGADPLKLTQISMALTSASLPLGVLPFLVLMNDRRYLGEHVNGHIGNAIVLSISVMAMVLAVVSIPLELIGGGG